MLSFIIKLVLANLIGDFLVQPNHWVKDKVARKMRSPYLYFHIGVHALALLLLLGFNMQYWLGIVIIVVSHLLIDIIKLELTGRFNERLLFFADQIMHLLVIALVVYAYFPYNIGFGWLCNDVTLLTLSFLILVTVTSSIIIRIFVSRWDLSDITEKASLENAGKYIGMLERLFVFGFIVAGYWEGIGFLIAAKSVFRFGDLSRAVDRKLTEYILIGTLLSFGLAVISGVGYTYLISILK